MIDLVISNDCPHCVKQLEIMKKSFFEDEYRIISEGSEAYGEYDAMAEGFPFLVVKDDDSGEVTYAAVGVHSGTQLRKIQRVGTDSPVPFNLRHARAVSG